MINKWTQYEIDIIVSEKCKDLNSFEISDYLSSLGFVRTPSSIRNLKLRLKSNFLKNQLFLDIVSINPEHDVILNKKTDLLEVVEDDLLKTVEKINEKKELLFNIITKKYSQIGRPKGPLTKTLAISDLHVPWEDPSVIIKAITDHSDADRLVINGDILDLYSISKFPKRKSFLLRHEYETAFEWVALLADRFKEVHIIQGNHDHRVANYFAKELDPAVSFLVHTDILERITKGYNFNKHGEFVPERSFDNVRYNGHWYKKIGKTIFAHPNKYLGRWPAQTAIRVGEKLISREDFQSVVIGHTHHVCKVIWENKLMIEQGCCAIPADYENDANLKFGVQHSGYAVVYMDREGNVDFELSKPFFYRASSIPEGADL